MPIRLIDREREYSIDIDGTIFYYRQLNGRDQAMLGLCLSECNLSKDMDKQKTVMEIARHLPEIEPILSRAIVRTENPELTPSKIMDSIADPSDYLLLAFEIFNRSAVKEEEAKNSYCSSDSDTPKDAGTARAAMTENA